MQFDMDKTRVKLLDVNPRAELHGQEPKPAGDLKIAVDLTNDCLAAFAPSLKSLLYHLDESVQLDLADEGRKSEKGYLPHLRMPFLGPLKWTEEILSATVTVHHPTTEKNNVVMEKCKVNNFGIEAKQGGTVTLNFRVQGHPDEKGFGKLCQLIGTEVELSILPTESEPG